MLELLPPELPWLLVIAFLAGGIAGAVGGGGLGDFAIRYGHQRNQVDITFATVLILLLLVSVLQSIGTWIIKRTSH